MDTSNWDAVFKEMQEDEKRSKAARKLENAREKVRIKTAKQMAKESERMRKAIRKAEIAARAEAIAQYKARVRKTKEDMAYLDSVVDSLPVLRVRKKENADLFMRHALDSNRYCWAASLPNPVAAVAESSGKSVYLTKAEMLLHGLKLVKRKQEKSNA